MRLITHQFNHEVRLYCFNKQCPNYQSWYDGRVHDCCPDCKTITPAAQC